MVAVAVIGVLGTIATVGFGSWKRSVESAKLNSEVHALNSAVKAYLASNGSLEGCGSVEEVLARVKSKASEVSSRKILGATGSFVDERVQPVYYKKGELKEGEPRVIWDSAKFAFVVAREGEGTIKGFKLADTGQTDAPAAEERRAILDLATRDTWIWDYVDKSPDSVLPPDTFTTTKLPASSVPPVINPSPPTPKIPLVQPVFSIVSGTRPYTDFNLSLELSDPNPKQASFLVYSVDYGPWLNYTATPIEIFPDTVVQAQAIAQNTAKYTNSGIGSESYAASPIALVPPEIITDFERFDPIDSPEIQVTMNNLNDPTVSKVVFRIDGNSWSDYKGVFPLGSGSHPTGALIEAKSVGVNKYYTDSPVVTKFLGPGPRKLDPPIINFSREYFSEDSKDPVTEIVVSIDNPNPSGFSTISYEMFPVPGGSGAATGYRDYGGEFSVYKFAYPSGFGIRAYAKAISPDFEDSDPSVRYATAYEGIFGGHLDLDTSDFLSDIGSGGTSAHTHDITGKHNLSEINFFQIPESSQIEITEAITDPNQKFKIILVNADLTPGMRIVVEQERGTYTHRLSVASTTYDDTSTDLLPTLSLGGVEGSGKLTGLKIAFDKDVILNAEVIPTNTGDVKSNTPGKFSEWRNGALTVQAVAVEENGTDAFATDSGLSSGGHGAATTGLLWEGAVFWHWGGDSYNEDSNHYAPGQFNSIREGLNKDFQNFNP